MNGYTNPIEKLEIKNGYNHKVLIGKIEDEENVSYLQDKNDIKYNLPQNETLINKSKTYSNMQ